MTHGKEEGDAPAEAEAGETDGESGEAPSEDSE